MLAVSRKALGLAALLAASTCLTGVAFAQTAPPPVHRTVDAFGVNLLTGDLYLPGPSLSIGQGANGLTFSRYYSRSELNFQDNVQGGISDPDGVNYTVTVGDSSETFTLASGVYTSNQRSGSTLTLSGGTWTYTMRDGTVALFSTSLANPNGGNYGILPTTDAGLTQITRPNGDKVTYTYTYIPQNSPSAPIPLYRLQAITSSSGYQLHFSYDDSGGAYTSGQAKLVTVTGLNLAVDYCDPTVNVCSGLTLTWPSVGITVSSSTYTFTDALGRTLSVNTSLSPSYTLPSGETITYTMTGPVGAKVVSTVSNGTATWSYSGFGGSTAVTDPMSHVQTYTVNSNGQLASYKDGLNRTTSYGYDTYGRLTSVTRPEGDATQYAYDARNNITSVTLVPKNGSGLSNIVTSANYPSSCTNPVTCNEPTYTLDALGNETDYTYDSTHGGVLTITQPAPSAGAVRPQTRFTYSSVNAWYKNSSGTLVSGPSVYRLTAVSACRTTSSCAGGSDEVKSTIAYGSSGVANNLLPTSVSSGSGDGVLTATTTLAYDSVGNRSSITSPLSGGGQVLMFRYDADRELVGVIGPDPDGAGALKNRATRLTYSSDGLVTLVERGNVSSYSDTDWAAFTAIDQVTTTFDGLDRPTKVAMSSGGTTLALSQTSYDNANRVTCSVLRMNPAIFASPPASACTLGTTGSNGPDRIASTAYDAADEVTSVTTAYGTSLARAEQTFTYGSNGEVASVADGKGQLTTYLYDGFVRLSKIEYPTPTNGAVSSTTDYEQYSYDGASRISQDRRRDATTIAYAYDNLSRLTTIIPPTGQSAITMAYDNMGWRNSVATTSQTLTYAWDALGRQTGETGPHGTVSYQYDLAGRRTRMTWPDSFYVTYDYDLADELTAIRENGASSGIGVLASFAYDDLGRRTGLTRGDGVASAYGYDGASNLTSLAHTLSGTGNNQSLSYTYNAAGQALSRAGSNSAYAWSGAYNVSRSYAANGQNQLVSSGSATLSYDGRGNLASDGTNSYAYDTFNRMTGMGTASLSYDPAGRLAQSVGGGATTQFAYDGSDLIGEYSSSGTLLRRYVHGPGLDEPLVWYEGSGTTDRRFLVADSLGSVIAVADASGAPSYINSYDDYGIPGTSNTGRFQYAGQAWIPEVGLYHDKARTYSPTLGRFMQTDPIGYSDGLNFYAYVGNDPLNLRDPSGTDGTPNTVQEVEVTALRIFGSMTPRPIMMAAVSPLYLMLPNSISQFDSSSKKDTEKNCVPLDGGKPVQFVGGASVQLEADTYGAHLLGQGFAAAVVAFPIGPNGSYGDIACGRCGNGPGGLPYGGAVAQWLPYRRTITAPGTSPTGKFLWMANRLPERPLAPSGDAADDVDVKICRKD